MRTFTLLVLLLSASVSLAAPGAGGGSGSDGAGPYLGMEPFVVNVPEGPRMRFMQVKVQVMSQNPKVLEALQVHMPAARDALIMLFAHQDAAVVRTMEGREALRQQSLLAMQNLMGQIMTGADASAVEAIYFTDFVIQ